MSWIISWVTRTYVTLIPDEGRGVVAVDAVAVAALSVGFAVVAVAAVTVARVAGGVAVVVARAEAAAG